MCVGFVAFVPGSGLMSPEKGGESWDPQGCALSGDWDWDCWEHTC